MKRSASIVSVAIMASRLFGLVRELVFAAMFGAGALLDSYIAAFRIPNLLRDLLAEGALSTAFTTTFTKKWEKEGPAAAWHLTRLILTSLTLITAVVCLIGVLASPLLVQVTSFGFHHFAGKYELTVELTRLLFPFIFFVSLAAAVMGILNARNIFGIPASASTAFNVVSVIAGVAFAYLFDPQSDWQHPHFGEKALCGVCLGVLLGGAAQLLIQLPSLWKLGYRHRWELDWKDPGVRQVLHLMIPTAIAGGAVQVNVLINGMFASDINGANSWLNCAFRLMQFPIGVFGVAIATVMLPAVSRHEARADFIAFGKTVNEALRLAFFLTIPASVGLAVLAEPIIALIYQHGRFDAHATHQTALALRAYVIGLAGYSGIKILTPCFYALNQPRIPLRISLIGILLNVTLNFTLVNALQLGHVGLALTTGLIALINFTQLAWILTRHIDCGSGTSWLSYLGRVLLSAGVCGEVAYGIHWLTAPWTAGQLIPSALALGLSTSAAVSAYFGMTLLLGLPEATKTAELFLRKLRKR